MGGNPATFHLGDILKNVHDFSNQCLRVCISAGSAILTVKQSPYSVIVETTLNVTTAEQPLRVGGTNQTDRRVIFVAPKGGDVFVKFNTAATPGDAGNAFPVLDQQVAEIELDEAVTPSIVSSSVGGINTYVAEAK